jgi:peptidoglycan/LPS O-acetylase OafA/YrhL
MAHTSRIAEMDALRAFGALAILGYHLWPSTFFFGWTRADLFFVISGYLITCTILKHGSRPRFLFKFWCRRTIRLWPTYYLLMAVLCIRALVKKDPPCLDGLVGHLTFTQNLPYYWSGAVPRFPAEAIQTWSLAIEEQFYLVWPVIVILTGRSGVIPIALLLIVSSVTARVIGLYPAVALARSDGLALGAILAAIFSDHERTRAKITYLSIALVTISIAALAFVSGPASYLEAPIPGISGCGPVSILAVNLVYFGIIGLVICHTGHPLLRLLRIRAIGYLGQISYGIFLYHLLVIELVAKHLGPRNFATDVASMLLSISLALISWEWLERPIGTLKELFPYEVDSPVPSTRPGAASCSCPASAPSPGGH